jgi:ribosomal protein S18 acetylase RimI-like enzyme
VSDLTTDLSGSEDAFLELVYRASEAYNDFVYASRDLALHIQRLLFEKRACEFSPPNVWIVREGNEVLGMLAALSGGDLRRCRLRGALALAKSNVLQKHPVIGRRLQLAGQTLLKVQPRDFYISQIAVDPAARNRGLGKFLLDHAEREAQDRHCTRLVLEVSPSSAAAVRLYRRQSYRLLDHRRVTCPDGVRFLEFLHMAKEVPSMEQPCGTG